VNELLRVALWSAVTIALYCMANTLHRRWPRPWLMPVLTAPVFLAVVLLSLQISYQQYIAGTHWLVLMLGPAMVAFAVPVYEQRALIRAHWPVLLAGILAGSVTALLSSWALASLVGLDDVLMRTLLPRSVSSVFAMDIAGRVGGIPELAAVFVVLSGLLGAIIGEVLLMRIRLRSALTHGALFGMGAHAIGTAHVFRRNRTEGAIAGLVMVLAGVLNVLLAPLVAWVLS
jgi:predicted murein hydrolase (TIGR00659 family)